MTIPQPPCAETMNPPLTIDITAIPAAALKTNKQKAGKKGGGGEEEEEVSEDDGGKRKVVRS